MVDNTNQAAPAFDPDAYLAAPASPPPGSGGFDPDAYLSTQAPPSNNSLMDVIKSIPGAAVRGLTAGAALMGKAAAYEEPDPDLAEQLPDPEQAEQIVEKNVTGPLYQPETTAGKIASGAIEGITSNPPAAFMGPTGALRALAQTAISGAAATGAGEAARAIAPNSPAFQTAAAIAAGTLAPNARGIVQTAARAARRPFLIPPKPPDTGQFGTLTAGEAAGDSSLRAAEQDAYSGQLGKAAQQHAQQFFEVQRPQQRAEAVENIAGEMGGPSVATPPDAADMVVNELTNHHATSTANTQATGVRLANDMTDYYTGLSPTGGVQAESPMEAANIIQGAVANEAERNQAATNAAYQQFQQLPGHFHPATFNQVDQYILNRARAGTDPTIINPQTTPVAAAAVADLGDVTNGLKQARDPATGRIIPRDPITPQVVENARKRLNSFYGQALQNAQGPARNFTDLRATRRVMDAFDDFVSQKLQTNFIGGDPTAVSDSLDAARASHAQFRKTFTPQGQGDQVGPVIQKILGRQEGQAATPEEIGNWLYGKGGLPVRVAQRLIPMFGEDSPEVGALKQGLVSYITKAPPGAKPYTPGQVADRIDQFTQGPGSTLTRAYLSPDEITGLQQLGGRMRGYHTQINPEPDAVDKIIQGLVGTDNAPRASTAEAQRRLFGDVLNGGKNAEALLERLQQRLSPTTWGAYKRGLFKYAASTPEGMAELGPKKTADRLNTLLNSTANTRVFDNYERSLIKGYANFLRKTEIPQVGVRNWSQTAPAWLRGMRAMGNWVGRGLGMMISTAIFGPGEIAAAGGLLGAEAISRQASRIEANKAMAQMPIIADQMQKYYKAAAAYQRAQNLGTQKLANNALMNLTRSIRMIGFDPSQMPPPDNTPNRADGGAVDGDDTDDSEAPPPSHPMTDAEKLAAISIRPTDSTQWRGNWTPTNNNPPPPSATSGSPDSGAVSGALPSPPPGPPGPPGGASISPTSPIIPQTGPISPTGPKTPGDAATSPEQPAGPSGTTPATKPVETPSPDDYNPSLSDYQTIGNKILGIGGKLLGIGTPRYQLWPERIIRSALSAPSDVYQTGQLTERDPYGNVVGTQPEMAPYGSMWQNPTTGKWVSAQGFPSDLAIQKAQDISALQFAGGAGAAEEGALGVAGGKAIVRPDGHVPNLPPRRVNDPGAPDGAEPHKIPMSPYTYEQVGRARYEPEWDDAKFENVPSDKLRATQDWVTPNYKQPPPDIAPPEGVRTPDGLVHVFDGHHRANQAVQSGQPLRMVVGDVNPTTLNTEAGKPGAAIAAATESPFYSAVGRAIANAPQSRMQPDQWLGWLKNQPGVKQEELSWLNLNDKSQLPPELQKGPVTKQQMQNYFQQHDPNNLQIVEKSGTPRLDLGEEELDNQVMEEFATYYPNATEKDLLDYRDTPDGDRLFENLYTKLLNENLNGPKYYEYQLPGGTNYRETLVTTPTTKGGVPKVVPRYNRFTLEWPNGDPVLDSRGNQPDWYTQGDAEQAARSYGRHDQGGYTSSHWNEPNVLFHLRENDRNLPGVGKSLHLEEVQSDWHQHGAHEGYWAKSPPPEVVAYYKVARSTGPQSYLIGRGSTEEDALANGGAYLNGWRRDYPDGELVFQTEPSRRPSSGVPDAPFKNSWQDLALKTAISKAAREGYDAISWTPGIEQARRWGELELISDLEYNPTTGELAGYRPYDGDMVMNQRKASPDQVSKIIGDKAIVDRLLHHPDGIEDGVHVVTHVNLELGGNKKRDLYDNILVNKANDIGKKYGARVQWKDMWVPQDNKADLPARMIRTPVLQLTPKLKEAALKGLPLFTEAGKPASAISALAASQKGSAAQLRQLNDLYQNGYSVGQIAKEFGVPKDKVRNTINNLGLARAEAGKPGAAVAGLNDAQIEQFLRENPGASIFDLSGTGSLPPRVTQAKPAFSTPAQPTTYSPLGFSNPEASKIFINTVGKYVGEKEFADKYFLGLNDPKYTTVLPGELGPDGITVATALRKPGAGVLTAGSKIGNIEHQIYPGDHAHHDYVEISPKAPAGTMPKLLRNQIDLYNKMGINYVDLNANITVGSYAWARYGFVPDQGSWNMLRREDVPERLSELEKTGEVPAKLINGIRKEILSSRDPKSIWDLADIKDPVPPQLLQSHGQGRWSDSAHTSKSTKTIGQYLLKDLSWDGRLNLHDLESMFRFDDYIHKRLTGQ